LDDKQAEEPVDPVDLLVRYVPRHLWVTLAAVLVMLVSGWLFFKPPEPAPGADIDKKGARHFYDPEDACIPIASAGHLLDSRGVYIPAAFFSAATLSSFSHGASMSLRPKWPYAAVAR